MIEVKYLEDKYPTLYKDNMLNAYGGIRCDDGWLLLLEKCSANLEKMMLENPKLPKVVPVQIKEKFGTLRFYFDGESVEARRIITEAEKESGVTCEVCGKPGLEQNIRGWLKTVCNDDYNRIAKTATITPEGNC